MSPTGLVIWVEETRTLAAEAMPLFHRNTTAPGPWGSLLSPSCLSWAAAKPAGLWLRPRTWLWLTAYMCAAGYCGLLCTSALSAPCGTTCGCMLLFVCADMC
jgi:hypothetical protein